MRTPDVIVIHVGLKNTAQMPLVEHDHIVQTLAPDTPDEPFDIRRLPRTARCTLYLSDAQVTDTFLIV
jgi:hypothetical protein